MKQNDREIIKKIFNRISKLTYSELKSQFNEEYKEKLKIDTKYSNDLNIEGRLEREEHITNLDASQLKSFKSVVKSIQENYLFTEDDIDRLNNFTSRLNYLLKSTSPHNRGMADQMNNIKHGAKINPNAPTFTIKLKSNDLINDNSKSTELEIHTFFNDCIKSNTWKEFKSFTELDSSFFDKSFEWKLVYVFSNIKNCQDKTNYPLYYAAWQVTSEWAFDVEYGNYDTFCEHYRNIDFIDEPKLLHFSCYYYLIRLALRNDKSYQKLIDSKEEKEKQNIIRELRENEDDNLNIKEKTNKNKNEMASNNKFYILALNQLSRIFSIAQAGKEFDFTISTSESSISDSTISEDDFLLVSVDDKVYYQFKVVDKSQEEIRLKKMFEIEKKIGYAIDEEGIITEIDKEESDFICSKLFYHLVSKNDLSDDIQIDLKKKPTSINIPLNQIFYGPPGTGKTFNTINNTLKIIDPEFYSFNKSNRENLKGQFNEYVKKGNIVFTTFHQSMSYEDFIEGIKPVISNENNNNELEYEIEDGILKELVSNIVGNTNNSNKYSNEIVIDEEKFKNNVNKVSLGNSNEPEDEAIYKYCLKNNCIALGFGEDIDFSGVKNRNDIRERYKKNGIEISSPMDFNISSIERLVLWMEKGQLVFISNGNKRLRAIGVVSGGYYCDNTTSIRYSQFREVKWLYTDIDLPIKPIYGSYFSQQSIYQMSGNKFDLSYFTKSEIEERSSEKYVLIIDEINRGNVSSIFGELITLLEEDKRKGNKEELEVTLPYSKESFSIPNNLYIIGTMNTADRSVEALDTALRRRFSFVEMMPDVSLLESNEINGINLKDVLSTINDRIEILIDRDHTIGHSYFMNINNSKELKLAFKDKIVPLLQEYFYGDYGKIGLVLGNGFVKSHSKSKNPFAGFKYEGKEELNRDFYDLVTIDDTFDIINALEILLNKNKDNQD